MDDDQQFCLRWNNHQSTLISVFDTLLENGTLVDCTLAAEGKFLKAHKVVLSACSPYFASLLSQQYDKHPIFILKDVKFQELRAMMDYMYRGEVNISQDQLAALLKAAESLQIKGLSDSRGNAGGSGSGQKQPTNEHKQLSVPAAAAGKSGATSGYTLEQKRPRHTMGPSSIDSQELSGSREGSSSPTSRKRKKVRRRSLDNTIADNHEHSNSSSHSMQVNSSIPPSNTSAAIASVSTAATSSSTPTTVAAISGGIAAGLNVTKKTESVSNAKLESVEHDMDNDNDDDDDDEHDDDKSIAQVRKEQNHKRKTQQTAADSDNGKDNSEMLIEPKSEYDEGNDETVEDLTLDDEELLDDLEQAGPSHGGGEGSSQGYAQWQVDRSQDDVFMATQEAAGQQRDPQDIFPILGNLLGINRKTTTTYDSNNYLTKLNNTMKLSQPTYRCQYCSRFYLTAAKLRAHIVKYCSKEKKFKCIFCDYRSRRKDHIYRHLGRMHPSEFEKRNAAGLPSVLEHTVKEEDAVADDDDDDEYEDDFDDEKDVTQLMELSIKTESNEEYSEDY